MSDSFKSKNYSDDDYYGNKKNNKKQDHYHSGSSYQQNRDYRQASEPRNQGNFMGTDRSRDTRSVEANKPPTGRRNSNSKDPVPHPNIRLPQNILHLPPRLQKAYLKENGLPLDYLDHIENNQGQQNNWNNTMPLGGRGGRNHHHQQPGQRFNNNNGQNYHHKHQQNYYQNDYDNNYRSLTPPPRNRNENYHRNDWKQQQGQRFDNKTPPSPNNDNSPKISADSKFVSKLDFFVNSQ
jgi:hypothetical protein